MTATDTSDLGRTVVTFDADAIHRAIARAAANALRDGVEGQFELADLRAAEGATSLPAVVAAELAVEHAQAQAVAAFTALGLAGMTGAGRSQLQLAADGAAAALEAARTELATVTLATHERSGASSRMVVAQFHKAIAALVKRGGRVSQSEAVALEKIFCDLRLVPVNAGRWAGTCFMRLPLADGSVLRCGPLEWELSVPFAADSRRVALALGSDGNFPWERHRSRAALLDAGVGHEQARTVGDCPMRWLHPLLMHAAPGRPLPPDMPDDWRDPKTIAWLAHVYTTRPWTWTGHVHTYLRYPAQAVLNALASLGGSGHAGEIAALIAPATATQVAQWISSTDVVDDRGTRRWLVDRVSKTYSRHDGKGAPMTLHRCRCGQLIVDVVDCPEVPARLLCRCGRMPFAETFGMDPDTRLPADYLKATATAADCRQWLVRERPQPLWLGSVEVAIMSAAILDGDVWVTASQIAAAVTVDTGHVGTVMLSLERKGLAERRDTGPAGRWNPRLWRRLRRLDDVDWVPHSK